MSGRKLWLSSLASDAFFFALLYLWQAKEIDGAGNALAFFVWAFIVLRLLFGFFGDRSLVKTVPPSGYLAYHVTTELIAICVIAWLGHFWTAGLYVFSLLMYEGAKRKEAKIKKEPA